MKHIGFVEIFRSIQGEGYNAGRDAIFLRFAGCNLSCVFGPGSYCDTPYQQMNLKLSFEGLCTLVEEMPRVSRVRGRLETRTMLILTGGEPTLHPAFDAVVAWGVGAGYYVAVETNGTRWRTGLAEAHWVTVSPKDAVVQGSPGRYHNPHPGSPALDPRVISLLQERRVHAGEYRYVIGSRSEAPPVYPAFARYLSPATQADGQGQEHVTGFPGFVPGALARVEEIMRDDPEAGWRVSLQQHKLIGVR